MFPEWMLQVVFHVPLRLFKCDRARISMRVIALGLRGEMLSVRSPVCDESGHLPSVHQFPPLNTGVVIDYMLYIRHNVSMGDELAPRTRPGLHLFFCDQLLMIRVLRSLVNNVRSMLGPLVLDGCAGALIYIYHV